MVSKASCGQQTKALTTYYGTSPLQPGKDEQFHLRFPSNFTNLSPSSLYNFLKPLFLSLL